MRVRISGQHPGALGASALAVASACASCFLASCGGSGVPAGAHGDAGSMGEAGFKVIAAPTSDAPHGDAEEDQVLPPEILWSPQDLGSVRQGQKKQCFPRTEKEYAVVLARAGKIEIPVSEFTAVFHPYTLDATKSHVDSLDLRKSIAWDLIDIELLALVGQQKGYGSKQPIEMLRKRELAEKIRKDLKSQAAKEIGEGAYKAYYKLHAEDYRIHPDQRKVARILVKGKKNALAIIEDLGPGTISIAAFAKKARELSLETDAKKTGGLTSWFDREGMNGDERVVPEKLAVIAFTMKKGEVSGHPFASSSGNYVFQMVAAREEVWIPYSKVRPGIVAIFVSERAKVLEANLLESMRKNHPVSINLQILEKISPVPCL